MISIIIPVYNCENYILNCLNSIALQTYKNYELLLINDCSTDNSLEIIKDFIGAHPDMDIKVIEMGKNSGQSAARNKGIHYAKGDYILFIDGDDSISNDCLELMVNKNKDGNYDTVIGEHIIQKNSNKKYIHVEIDDNEVYGNSKILSYYVNYKWYNTVWNKLIKKDIIIRNKIYFLEGFIFEDELWSFMLATKIDSLCIIRHPLYTYYIRPNSTMDSNKKAKRWNGLLKVLPFMKDYIIEHKLNNNLEVARFFLYKLVLSMNELEKEHLISYDKYLVIKSLNYVNLINLVKNKIITNREFIAYFHFQLPNPLSFMYYKMIMVYFNLKK